MANKYYTGTAEQALNAAEYRAYRWTITQREADDVEDVDEALTTFKEYVDTLDWLLDRRNNKKAMSDALQQITDVQEALDILLIKMREEFDEAQRI